MCIFARLLQLSVDFPSVELALLNIFWNQVLRRAANFLVHLAGHPVGAAAAARTRVWNGALQELFLRGLVALPPSSGTPPTFSTSDKHHHWPVLPYASDDCDEVSLHSFYFYFHGRMPACAIR
jgi:hypothetical protein